MERIPTQGRSMEGMEGEKDEAGSYLIKFREAVQCMGVGVRFDVDGLAETARSKKGTNEGEKAMAKLKLAAESAEKLQELFRTEGGVNLGEFNKEIAKKLEEIEAGIY